MDCSTVDKATEHAIVAYYSSNSDRRAALDAIARDLPEHRAGQVAAEAVAAGLGSIEKRTAAMEAVLRALGVTDLFDD